MDSSTLLRPLSGAERFYWLLDRVACTNFVILAAVDGPVSPAALGQALDQARARHPLLGATVRVDGILARFVQLPEAPLLPTVREGDEEAWLATGAAELDHPFPPGTHPLVRVALLRDEAVDRLVFTFNHGISDARSAALLVEEVLRYLPAPGGSGAPSSLLPLPLHPPQEALYPLAFRGWRARLRAMVLNLVDVVGFLRVGARLLPGVDRTRWLPRRVRTFHFHLPEEQTTALVERCRQERTTVQGALCAAQALAIREELPGEGVLGVVVGSAVDMRAHLVPPLAPENLGMYASFVPSGFRVARDTPFWDLAREARGRLERRLAVGGPFLVWSTFPGPWLIPPDETGARRLLGSVLAAPPSSFVTNLGRLPGPEGDPGPGVRDLRFLMAPQPGSVLCTSVLSFRGALRIASSCNLSVMDADRGRVLAERVVSLLQAAFAG